MDTGCRRHRGAGAVGLAAAEPHSPAPGAKSWCWRLPTASAPASSRNSKSSMAACTIRPAACDIMAWKAAGSLHAPGTAERPHQKRGKLIIPATDSRRRRSRASSRREEEQRREHGADRRRQATIVSRAPLLHGRDVVAGNEHRRFTLLCSPCKAEIEDHGGMLAFETPVTRVGSLSSAAVSASSPAEPSRLGFARRLIDTSAGLGARGVRARSKDILSARFEVRAGEGHYFGCAGRPAFTRLIYPRQSKAGSACM